MSFATSFARALVPVVLVASVAAPGRAQSGNELKQVEASLTGTQSLVADFVQSDNKGRQIPGTLALKRPGKIRFAYGAGVNALMVADGKTLHYLDYDVNQHNKWSIAKSPLSVLLSPQPDLGRIARIVPGDDPTLVIVRARDARRPEFGTLFLAFRRSESAPGGLRLDGWTAIDAQNKRTRVILTNQRYNVAVPDSSFTFAEVKKTKA